MHVYVFTLYSLKLLVLRPLEYVPIDIDGKGWLSALNGKGKGRVRKGCNGYFLRISAQPYVKGPIKERFFSIKRAIKERFFSIKRPIKGPF